MTWTEITAKLTELGYRQRYVTLSREVWEHPDAGRVTIASDRRGNWSWDREPADAQAGGPVMLRAMVLLFLARVGTW